MEPVHLKKLNEARRNRKPIAVVTDLDSGRERLVTPDQDVPGELGQSIRKAFSSGKGARVEVSGTSFFINPHVPSIRIVAIGAVHITQALVPVARAAGYGLTIIDPRTAFATPERFEGSVLHAEWPDDVLSREPLDAFTALIAVTHDPKIDDGPLMAGLKANCFYVGALGSRKTHGKRQQRFLEAGLSQDQIDTIKAPIGIDIGAASPGEIAVAIMAQIILALRGPKIGDG